MPGEPMSDLDKAREEWVEKHCNLNTLESHRARRAWNAALEYVSKAAGEWSNTRLIEISNGEAMHYAYRNGLERGMREQFEQDRARIGLAEHKLAESSEKQLQLAFKFNAAVDRRLEVEDKLQTSGKEIAWWREQQAEWDEARGHFVRRVRELEAQLNVERYEEREPARLAKENE